MPKNWILCFLCCWQTGAMHQNTVLGIIYLSRVYQRFSHFICQSFSYLLISHNITSLMDEVINIVTERCTTCANHLPLLQTIHKCLMATTLPDGSLHLQRDNSPCLKDPKTLIQLPNSSDPNHDEMEQTGPMVECPGDGHHRTTRGQVSIPQPVKQFWQHGGGKGLLDILDNLYEYLWYV